MDTDNLHSLQADVDALDLFAHTHDQTYRHGQDEPARSVRKETVVCAGAFTLCLLFVLLWSNLMSSLNH